MNHDHLGRGLAVPLRLDGRGSTQMSGGRRKVRESIRTILGTHPGERLMRPDFGCRLKSLVFAPNNGATANLARHHVEQALRRWEPRIEVQSVDVTNRDPETPGSDSSLVIHIHYLIRSTNQPDSLVYPFYLEATGDSA